MTRPDIDAIEALIASVPTCPLLVHERKGSPPRASVWMDDAGDLRFVADMNEAHGPYGDVLVGLLKSAPALLAYVRELETALRTATAAHRCADGKVRPYPAVVCSHGCNGEAVDLVALVGELEAVAANERGKGEPPSEGWVRNDFDPKVVGPSWYRPARRDGSTAGHDEYDYPWALWVYREPGSGAWSWDIDGTEIGEAFTSGKAPTAREAMRAADAALEGM